jgi:hypothetical protein
MRTPRIVTFAAAAVATLAGQAAGAPDKQPVTGPVAIYWMSASTATGMGAMAGMGGGGRPSMAQIMAMEQGASDPNAASHSLTLQLGSSRKPDGPPSAEHDPPAALGVGASLPLVTPQAQPVHEEAPAGPPPQYQPHGRMLIFWGCGAHAGPGQPVVVDLSTASSDPVALGRKLMGADLGLVPAQPPSPSRNATYGEWPNPQSSAVVPPDASLQGAHVVRGDYSPEIDFSLTADQDFLPPFQLTANQKNPDGSASLGWRRVDGAQGYVASMTGARSADSIVIWTSSEVQASSFALPQYLSDGEIARLVAAHVLMGADARDCTVPQEAVEAAGGMAPFRLVAYGGEANLSYPPRPPAPQPWHIAWQVKVRYRSETSGMLGMDMSQMGAGRPRPGEDAPPQQPHHNPFNPFGGF